MSQIRLLAEAPPQTRGAEDPWGPLGRCALPPVEPFPLEVLPNAAARLVREGAEAIGCPADFLAVPALAVAAGVIGRSVVLRLKDGFDATSALFAGCVGRPSDGKFTALKRVADPLRRIDEHLQAEYAQALARWRQEPSRSREPKPRRLALDHLAGEPLPDLAAENPRGLIRVEDDLAAILAGRYALRGNDRSNLLRAWSGDTLAKHRRGLAMHLTLVGGLSPEALGDWLGPGGRSDGLTERFLLAYPDPVPVAPWSERGWAADMADAWRHFVDRLWVRPMLGACDGRPVPHVAQFTPDAKLLWAACYDDLGRESNADDFPPALAGPWANLREHAGRLTLILACLRHAADPAADPGALPAVEVATVRDAWRLVAYFKSHARRVHAASGPGAGAGGGAVVKAIVDWLRQGERRSFTERDVKQARRWIDEEALAAALHDLEARQAIRRRASPAKSPLGGRTPSPEYDVNPALLDTQNPQNPQNVGAPAGGAAP